MARPGEVDGPFFEMADPHRSAPPSGASALQVPDTKHQGCLNCGKCAHAHDKVKVFLDDGTWHYRYKCNFG